MSKKTTAQAPGDNDIYGLKKAVANSWAAIVDLTIDEMVKRASCILDKESKKMILPFFGRQYSIDITSQVITTAENKTFNNLFQIGIMLHYMAHAQNIPLKNQLISFRELWGGNEYFYAFENRVLKPLIAHFQTKPEDLINAGLKLSGKKIAKGEYGVVIPALPRVPITILFWSGDDEVAASANVLFDASANEQMETEALVWLSIATVGELKASKLNTNNNTNNTK